MQSELLIEHAVFLSTDFAGRREVRSALAVVSISCAIFFAAAPFAKMPVTHVSAFIPIYVTALVICDMITAVLLFGQFHFLRSGRLLILGSR
jgi:hypothetical protein